MSTTKQLLTFLVCFFLSATAVAQEPQLSRPSRDAASQEVTIIIRQQQLSFTAPASTQEIRLEVLNKADELVYDSGFVASVELSWALRNAIGEAIPGGLYAYRLTIKDANSETPTMRSGHFILESARDRIWVTSQGALGAEGSLSGGDLTVSSGAEGAVAGAPFGRSDLSRWARANSFSQFDTPIPGRIAKFDNFSFLINSVISEDASARIGIGTTTPGSKLTVAGTIETTSGGIKFPNGSVQNSAGLSQVSVNSTLTGNGTSVSPLGVNVSALNLLSAVAHDTTLAGNGTTGSPLSIANGGVTAQKIASGQVVKSLNGLFDNLNLTAGSNITITPSGNDLSISAPGALSSVTTNFTLIGNGTGSSPLGVAVPLRLVAPTFNGDSLIHLTNTNNNGFGLTANGGDIVDALGGHGIQANGGDSNVQGGNGIQAMGGAGDLGGGHGVIGNGGASINGVAGVGLWGIGGDGSRAGPGVVGVGGRGASGHGEGGVFGGDVRINGNVGIVGNLTKSGGSFKIDHPLDPAKKYLYHSFVESPDMKNIYDGVVRLDADGAAFVELPEWFEALNKEFRYLLTPVGAPMPGLYIAEEVSGNRFRIAGGQPGSKVSWQVTGVRQDAYANKHRIPVEEDKPERERGYYLHPEVFNQAEEKSVEWALHPEMMREIKRRRQEAEIRRQEKAKNR